MNYPAVLIWSTVCTLIIFFFLLSLQDADAYKLDILPHKLKTDPVVCFYDTPKPFKWHTYKSIHMWNDSLNNDPYKVRYKQIPLEYSAANYDGHCNIHVRFTDEIWWNGEQRNWWGVANCADTFCSLQIDTQDRSHVYKLRTIAHEIGHALSLGHIRPETPPEALALPCSHNLMWEFPCAEKTPMINKLLIDAIRCVDKYSQNYCVNFDVNKTMIND